MSLFIMYLCLFFIINIFMRTTLEISVRLCTLMCLSSVILCIIFIMLILLLAFASKLCLIVMYIIVIK